MEKLDTFVRCYGRPTCREEAGRARCQRGARRLLPCDTFKFLPPTTTLSAFPSS
jgi:hypothetical protein